MQPMVGTPGWFRAVQAGYLVVAGGVMVFFLLWTVSPGFRYWLWAQSKEIQYRWALAEYQALHEPVPDWVNSLRDSDLPKEE